MILLEAADLVVRRGGRVVVEVPDLQVTEGETLALLGPNGAGKTSLLLALAGLLPHDGGLRFRGAPLGDVYRRRIAVVFQRPLLLNDTVLENAALGLTLRGVPRAERNSRTAAALARLGIEHLRSRRARTLSGGEAQRVSLARALAFEPELLFLDEPFAGLDPPSRESLTADLSRALRAARTTCVLVTHDRDEALSLGDRVAVLIAGRIRQVDRAERVFAMPADTIVADFVGVENVLPAHVERVTEELTTLVVGGQRIDVTALPPGGESSVLLCVRPDDIVLALGEHDTSARNSLAARIVSVEPLGRVVRIVLDCGFSLVAHVTVRSARELGLGEGASVVASFKATAPHLLSARPMAQAVEEAVYPR